MSFSGIRQDCKNPFTLTQFFLPGLRQLLKPLETPTAPLLGRQPPGHFQSIPVRSRNGSRQSFYQIIRHKSVSIPAAYVHPVFPQWLIFRFYVHLDFRASFFKTLATPVRVPRSHSYNRAWMVLPACSKISLAVVCS